MSRFREIVELFREETDKPDVHPMVGAIGMSTDLVVEKISFAHDTGFRMFQIALPPWGTLTDEEYMVYFKDVCGSFPDSKFLHYNLPRAGRVLEGSDYARLQDAIPNLVATKNGGSSSVSIAGIVTESPELQHFLVEPVFPYGCLHGECSLLASLAAVSPTKPELPISSCLDPSNAPSSTRAIVVSLTDAVNHPIKLTKPSLGVVS